MGKSRPRNRTKNRDNPAGRPVKPPSDPELAALREKRILPILEGLQSAEPKTRSASASAISNIIEDSKCRKLLLREKIVKILFEQTLTDSNLETRTAGWGILRNLALEEESDFCIHLYRQDVLTAIEGVIRTVSYPSFLFVSPSVTESTPLPLYQSCTIHYAHRTIDHPNSRISRKSSIEAATGTTESCLESGQLCHQPAIFAL